MKANHDACAGEDGGAPYHLRGKAVQPTLPHEDFARAGSCFNATTPLNFRTSIIKNLVFSRRFFNGQGHKWTSWTKMDTFLMDRMDTFTNN